MSNKSFNSPRSIDDPEGFIGNPEGGRLMMSEPNVCSYRYKRWVSSGAKDENRHQGKWKMIRVGGVCAHNRLSCCKRWRGPTNQMSLCQTQPGIPEGVFQWWCCPRKTTTRRREWVSAEMAIPIPILMPSLGFTYLLRSLSNHHEAHRLWSNADISAFDIFFPMLYCMQDINSMTRRWSGTSCMESPEAYHWDSRTAGNPGKP